MISLVESNEMARIVLPSSASGISSFKRGRPVSAAQCLWSMTGFIAAGFTPSDLIPISIDLVAANKSLLRLQGHSPDSEPFSCATVIYVSEAARGFYLSWEEMMDLGIVSPTFHQSAQRQTPFSDPTTTN